MPTRLPMTLICMLASVVWADPGSAEWKKQVETAANSASTDQVAKLAKALGTAPKVAFDWKRFKPADWQRGEPEFTAGRCLYTPADVITDLVKKPEYKAGLARLKTITCKPSSNDDVKGVAIYTLVDDATHLVVEYCESCGGGKLDEVFQDGLKSDGELTSHELAWRAHTTRYANNLAEDSAEDQSAGAHQLVKSGCGHDVDLTFDWKTLSMKAWFERGNPALHEQMLEWAGTEILKNMGRICSTPKVKKKLAKVKHLTVHGTTKPPMLTQQGATRAEIGPKYKLDGDTLEAWLAPGVQLRDEYLEAAVKK